MLSIPPAPLGIAAVAVAVVFVFLDFAAVVLRLWAKKIKQRPLDATDYLILGALVCVPAFSNHQL
ncbi:hypothetical protein P171DRAFT_430869 [Karstenula rhodostoma CBS 690.94]|uniref:Uncharacterized protein n=1 Tax=Karstenula rhodostoma CBS 690.94 TaxID=1392251 RepID=A0A9P4PM67_9PLEO|nr:hypothetical protein P171DRAFT_430869 [Karstenula rhodostoma CBS 690.94]